MIPFWITIFLSASSIIGGVVNARGRIEGFYIWIATSIAWGWISIIDPSFIGQLPMWTAYLIISVYGVIVWRRKSRTNNVATGRDQAKVINSRGGH